MNPPGRDPSAADPPGRRPQRRSPNGDQNRPSEYVDGDYVDDSYDDRDQLGSGPNTRRPPGVPASWPENPAAEDFDGTGPTTALPRRPPATRRPPISEQPTTALPRRRPPAPPRATNLPGAPLPRSFNEDRATSAPRQRPRPSPRYEPELYDPAYPDPAYPDPAYPDPAYPDPAHRNSPHSDRAHPDNRYENSASPQTRRPAAPPAGYQDGQRDHVEVGFPDSRPDHSRPDQTRLDQTRLDQPRPDNSRPDRSLPDYEQPEYGAYSGSGPTPPYPSAPNYSGPEEARYEDGTEIVGPPSSAPDWRPAPRGAHLPPYQEPLTEVSPADPQATSAHTTRPTKTPRKLTVTRVAAMRSRELTLRGVDIFQKATTADGADRSGLAHLTYATMANYATDAALVVALANTLFLVDPKQGVWKVLLYLVITVAPFAFIAPVIGPMLDRLQTGRRLALAASMVGRGVLALLMIFTFTGSEASWALYPCALGSLVFSKSFGVLKASLTPRVLPAAITLVKTNSRLTVFGLIAGGVAGGVAAGFTWAFGSAGALIFTAVVGFAGAFLCLKIPSWVESTEGEVPLHATEVSRQPRSGPTVVSESVRTTLWANSAIRIETGFLAMFIAFVVMKEYDSSTGIVKLLLLGVVGVAAGFGGFLGNALGAKLTLRSPEVISLWGGVATLVATIVAAFLPGLMTAALVGLIGSTSSSLAKVCLDSVIQRDLPEASRASAFGRSETALQLAWVFGGVVGLLLGGLLNLSHNTIYTIGFVTVSLLLILGLVQTWMVKGGRTMVPTLRIAGRRKPKPAGSVPMAKSANAGYGPSVEETTRMTMDSDETRVDRPAPTARMKNAPPTKRSGGGSRLPKRAKDRRSGEPL